MSNDNNKISQTARNVAILLLSLGEKGAAHVFKNLSKQEVRQITTAMATMPPLRRDEVQGILSQFFHEYRYEAGFIGGTKQYLEKSLQLAMGEKDANKMMESIFGHEESGNGMEMIKWMGSSTIAELIANEHPQLQAVLLANLDPKQASEVLKRLPQHCHNDLLARLAKLEELHPAIIQELNAMFDDNMVELNSGHNTAISGMRQVADIMNRMNDEQTKGLIEHFKKQDEKLAEELENHMFVFDNLAKVNDEAINRIVAEVSQEVLVMALKGSSDELMNMVMGNMAKSSAKYLQDDIDNLGSVRASQVQAARKEMLDTARKLADEGEIELNFRDEEMIE
ncbi:MAG: flagellar motor switch protein FliG [Endozoicomonadaceae bacterium]|nr:flagellar motor switch protein FliG [Endozoicomonadaceae bacterium]